MEYRRHCNQNEAYVVLTHNNVRAQTQKLNSNFRRSISLLLRYWQSYFHFSREIQRVLIVECALPEKFYNVFTTRLRISIWIAHKFSCGLHKMGVHGEQIREYQLFDSNLDFKIKILNFVHEWKVAVWWHIIWHCLCLWLCQLRHSIEIFENFTVSCGFRLVIRRQNVFLNSNNLENTR